MFHKIITAALVCAVSTAVQAIPVTAVFDSTIDLTPFGGSEGAAFQVEYTFDTDAPDQSSSNPVFGRYTGVSGTALIGTDTLNFTGGGIQITNDLLYIGNALDSYVFSTQGGQVTGTVLGRALSDIQFQLFDLEGMMFSSDSLPEGFGFTNQIDTGWRLLRDTNTPTGPYNVASFSQTSDGEFFTLGPLQNDMVVQASAPASAALMAFAVAGLVGMRKWG